MGTDTLLLVGLAGGMLLILATVIGFVLGWANRAFHVPIDLRQERVLAALPGANCGACGFVGCGDYAEAVVLHGAACDRCPVGGPDCAAAVAGIMGVSLTAAAPMRPVVHCSAHTGDRLQRRPYTGEATCHAINLVGGVQGCIYGCLGAGDCVRACAYDAIHVRDGLATVVYAKCIGCGACAKACPRKIITMVPFKAKRVLTISCSNLDFGKEVMAVCNVGCIGCKACTKQANVFTMHQHVARINYDLYTPDMDLSAAIEKCPRKVMVMMGEPTPEDLARTRDQSLPEVVAAQFETTVDKTEWRG
jgi:RnfABCDGE-type electron transport complex B subunit